MTTLLHLDASVRAPERSLSRMLSKHFVDAWKRARPETRVIVRDIGRDPPPHVSEEWIGAVFTAEGERTHAQRDLVRLSDTLIAELEAAQVIVLGTPMYNYGMPSALKAWVDQVVRIGKTFSFDLARGDFPLEPIMQGKILVTLTAKGEFGFDAGGIRAHMNQLDPHIRTVAHYLGAGEVHTVSIEYQEFGGAKHESSIAKAKGDAEALAARLCQRFA